MFNQVELPGFVYFISEVGNDEFVKIGKSAISVSGRLKTLQCGNPRKLYIRQQFHVQDCTGTESALHKLFKIQRYAGEWFHYSGKIERFLAHTAEYGLDQAILEYSIKPSSPEAQTLRLRGQWRDINTAAPRPPGFDWSVTLGA